MDVAIAKKRQAQNAVQSLQSQSGTVRTTVDSYPRGLTNITKCIETDVTDGFGGFLSEFLPETRKLIKKQRDIIELTVETDLETLEAFLRSLESEPSRPGSS